MRYLAWFALPFCAAVLLACKLPLWWIGGICALGALVPFVCGLIRGGKGGVRVCLLGAGAALGFFWFCVYTMVWALSAQQYAGQSGAFTATVLTYSQEQTYGVSVQLRMDSGLAQGVRTLTYLDEFYAYLKPGDQLTGTAEFSDAAKIWDQESSRYTAQGIFLRADVTVDSCYAQSGVPLRFLPAYLGHQLKNTVEQLFPGEQGGLLKGLLTGDKTGLSQALYTCFRRGGMAHLLAVSGLHVGFLTGLFYLLPGQKRRRVFLAIPVLVVFALMTGGQSSVWRAAVMAILLLIAPLFGRETDPTTSLSFALVLLLLQNPYAAESVGLQLSFAAVTGLSFFYPKMYRWMMRPLEEKRGQLWRRVRRLAAFVSGSVSAACCGVVLTLPLSAIYFQTISLVGPIASLLAVWAASAAFCCGLVACVAYWVCPPLGKLLACPTKWLLNYLIRVAETLGSGTWSGVRLDNLYLRVWLAALLVTVALVVLIKPLRRRPILPIGCCTALLLLGLTFRMVSITSPSLSAAVLDVGQGSGTVFCSGGCFAAVDCGGEDAGDKMADYVQSAGSNTLSLLVLTHFDDDHVDGLETLLAHLTVETIALPDVADEGNNRSEICALALAHGCALLWVDTRTEVRFGSAELTIFPPVTVETDNASCISVLCSWESYHLLVTGDLEQAQEALLLERESLPRLDLLVAGHHGSDNSTGEQLLAQLAPRVAVISVGDNCYGLPSEETLTRLVRHRCTIYRTDENGTVTLRYR